MTGVAKMFLGSGACEANGLRDNNYKKKERSEVVLFRLEIGRGLCRRLGFGLGLGLGIG